MGNGIPADAAAAASLLLNMHYLPEHIHVLRQRRSARPRRPRTNLGRQLVLKKNFSYKAYARLIILTLEQGSSLFASIKPGASTFIFTDLSNKAEMEMGVYYLDKTRYTIGSGWEEFVIKHGRPTSGVVWFYKEFDIWGRHVKNSIKFVKPKSITKSVEVGKTEVKKDDSVHKKRKV